MGFEEQVQRCVVAVVLRHELRPLGELGREVVKHLVEIESAECLREKNGVFGVGYLQLKAATVDNLTGCVGRFLRLSYVTVDTRQFCIDGMVVEPVTAFKVGSLAK